MSVLTHIRRPSDAWNPAENSPNFPPRRRPVPRHSLQLACWNVLMTSTSELVHEDLNHHLRRLSDLWNLTEHVSNVWNAVQHVSDFGRRLVRRRS